MPASFNRVILAGTLTRDPQLRFLGNERAVCNFGLAINRRYRTGDGQQKEETTFVDIEAWGRTAELVGQYLTKGRSALVEGRLKLDNWEDRNTGDKRSKLSVVADTVQFLGGRGEGDQAAGGGGGYAGAAGGDDAPRSVPPPAPAGEAMDDEPPF